MVDGKVFSGQIISKDSTEKIGNVEQKTAGKDGDALTHNGKPLYQYTEFTSDLEAKDVKIVSDRGVATAKAKIAASGSLAD